MIVPGIAGLACLVLAGIAFQILPFSWIGLLLLAARPRPGGRRALRDRRSACCSLAGSLCMLLGGSMVFDLPEVSDLSVSFWPVLVPVVARFGVFAALVVFAVGPHAAAARRPPASTS